MIVDYMEEPVRIQRDGEVISVMACQAYEQEDVEITAREARAVIEALDKASADADWYATYREEP